jgi:hypothetical protein
METTMKTSLFLFCATLALTGLACSTPPNPLGSTTTGTGGQGGSVAATTTSVGGTTGAGGNAAVDPGTWKLDSNLTVNGHPLGKDLRSAVARTVDLGQGPQMVVELTTTEGYCELLRVSELRSCLSAAHPAALCLMPIDLAPPPATGC